MFTFTRRNAIVTAKSFLSFHGAPNLGRIQDLMRGASDKRLPTLYNWYCNSTSFFLTRESMVKYICLSLEGEWPLHDRPQQTELWHMFIFILKRISKFSLISLYHCPNLSLNLLIKAFLTIKQISKERDKLHDILAIVCWQDDNF